MAVETGSAVPDCWISLRPPVCSRSLVYGGVQRRMPRGICPCRKADLTFPIRSFMLAALIP